MIQQSIKPYYYLTKPGIIYGNLLTCAAGFLLAAKGTINPLLFLTTLLGTAGIIASACVFNNYLDRHIDKKMQRTQKRALVTGKISVKNALIFGSVLGIAGVSILFYFTNFLTTLIGVIGFVFYVWIYGYVKRKSDIGTLVGTIPGATPPLAGYIAVTNHIDTAAVLLFLILLFWQMTHFYAIAIYRLADYKAADIPVLPATQGIYITKIHMIFYTFGLLISVSLLTIFGYTDYVYLFLMLAICCYWFYVCIKGFFTKDDTVWAKGVFKFSLLVILIFSLLLYAETILP